LTDNILVIDIETVPIAVDYSELDPRLQVQWDKKSKWIPNPENLEKESLFSSKAGIYAEFGKVVCISLGYFIRDEHHKTHLRIKAFYDEDERQLLTSFVSLVTTKFDQQKTKFVSHNGKEFDFPFICRRMLIHGIALPPILQLAGKKPWEIPHIDTLEFWKFGDYKHFTSLELLATLFDIPTSKEDIDGSKVGEVYYQENDLKRIARYCCNDVVVTAQLYLKLHAQPMIEKENIHILIE
jgi:3'-5' exonuclease